LADSTKPQVIWIIVDGKPGHQNQSEGLVTALSRLIDIQTFRLPVAPFWKTLIAVLLNKQHALKVFSKPDFVIGAGHKTHSTLLLFKWLFKAKAIVLMKPSLPKWLFDLCIIPEHDGAKTKANVIATKGVLNRVVPSENKQINKGMILVGGPSTHYDWDEEVLISQIKDILAGMSHIEWAITDSRRTPETTSLQLKKLQSEKVIYESHVSVDSDWLPEQLADSSYAWVTADSVSMVYEALTAKNHVGLLSVPEKTTSRVSQGVRKLVKEKYLKTFDQWQRHEEFEATRVIENESDRCAHEIMNKFI
jgi:mitochondrial fission protein ELM1